MKSVIPFAVLAMFVAGPAVAAGMDASPRAGVAVQERMVVRADPEVVRQVQTHLLEQGYDVGPIDGLYGPQTRQALIEYQRDRGLPVTGEIDRLTVADLGVIGSPDVAEADGGQFEAESRPLQERPGSPDIEPPLRTSPTEGMFTDEPTEPKTGFR